MTVTVSRIRPSSVSEAGTRTTTRRRAATVTFCVASAEPAAETVTIAASPTSLVRSRTTATTKKGRPIRTDRTV